MKLLLQSAQTAPSAQPVEAIQKPSIQVDDYWLPHQRSTLAPEIDSAFWTIYWIDVAFFVVIIGAIGYFMVKYKRRSDKDRTSPIDHNFRLEVFWTLIPSLLLIWFFVIGFRGYVKATVAPGDSMEVQVTAQMYEWRFTYPDGTTTINELGVPVNKPVKLIMSSRDVLHSFFVSEFRVKSDVIPGHYTTLWFQATEEGETALQCTEYCGRGHSDMLGTVKIMKDADFEKWLENGGMMEDLPPAELGAKIFATRSCQNCHSLDGTRIQGPPLNGIMGRTEQLADGSSVVVDENYIRESILDPQAKVVKGYPAVMPTYKGVLKDKHIDAVIAFLKTKK